MGVVYLEPFAERVRDGRVVRIREVVVHELTGKGALPHPAIPDYAYLTFLQLGSAVWAR